MKDATVKKIISALQKNKDKEKAVVHVFNPYGTGDWWLTDYEGDNICFGLCDLGFPEYGSVCLKELSEVRIPIAGEDMSLEFDEYYTSRNVKDIMQEIKG
jgi:hypothetical protein